MPFPLGVAEANNYLRSRHVAVLAEWTEECLDWLQQEYQDANVTSHEMKENVYDQWLDSDLAEIASPVLPPGFTRHKKTLLTGNYALQINSVQDVSVPAYTQMLKTQGKENENAHVTATQSTQQTQNKFEQKSSRMLMLQLTDGHQSFEGMEYQPISHLSVDTQPGTKILVHGSVQCSHGVLMLTADNVQVLGGEVESLVETNSKIQVLYKALGLDGGQVTQQEASNTTANQRQSAPQDIIDLTTDLEDNVRNANRNRNQAGSGVNRAATGAEEAFFSDDLGDDMDALMLEEIERIEKMDQVQRQASSADEGTGWPADEDEIDEMWLQHVEQSHAAQAPHQHHTTKTKTKADEVTGWPADEDEIDEMWLQHGEQSHAAQAPHRPGLNTQTKPRTPNEYPKPSSSLQDTKAKSQTVAIHANSTRTGFSSRDAQSSETRKHTPISQQNQNTGQKLDAKDTGTRGQASCSIRQDNAGRLKQDPQGVNKIASSVTFGTGDRYGDRNPSAPPRSINVCKPGRAHDMNVNVIPDHQTSSSVTKPTDKKGTASSGSSSSSVSGPPSGLSHKPQTGNTKPTQAASEPPSSLSVPSHRSSLSHNSQTGSTKPTQATGLASRNTKDSVPNAPSTFSTSSTDDQTQSSGVVDPVNNQKDDIIAAKRRRFYSSEGVGCGSVSLESSSLVKLSSVMSRIQSKEEFAFTIKGFIVTLTSPLDRKNGYWSISAKISDKTALLDVNLSNEVLTTLIGFSVPEMIKIKKTLKTSDTTKAKELETKLREGLAQCQKSLIALHSTMTIEVNLNQQRPLVISVGATDPSDVATQFREVPNKS